MTGDQRRLLLLDSASLYFRAFFGVKDLRRAEDGTPTNALRGMLDMVATLVTRFRPDEVAACWDESWRPAFRVAAIPSYKAHRVVEGTQDVEQTPPELDPQVPLIRTVLGALGIPVVGAAGYEADDVIATLATRHRGRGPVAVVTGDRDLFQLVDDAAAVTVVYTARGGVRDAEVITQTDLAQRYGVPTGAAYADMAVLRGDTSDGLPGVKGIGDKSASQLIRQFGSLAGVLAALRDGDPTITGARRANLEAAGDYLAVAPAVVRTVTDVPVPDLALDLPDEAADPETLLATTRAYGLAGPVGRVMSALGLQS